MKSLKTGPLINNHILRVALAVLMILLIPLVAMQFSKDVHWKLNDFIIAGALLFFSGIVLDLIILSVQDKKRKRIAVGILSLALIYIWVELAVGIFTNLGS